MQDSAADALLVFHRCVWHSEQFQMLKHRHRQGTAIVYAPAVGHANKCDVPPALSSTSFWIFCTHQKLVFPIFQHALSNSLSKSFISCLLHERQCSWRHRQAAMYSITAGRSHFINALKQTEHILQQRFQHFTQHQQSATQYMWYHMHNKM